jgi:osmoprotectant transport system substrate-binding protein
MAARGAGGAARGKEVSVRTRRTLSSLLPALLAALVACGSTAREPAPSTDGTVRIASYDFPENQVLAELYAEAARRAGIAVTVQHGTGTREVLFPALEQGVVDVVVDYLGTALAFSRPGLPRIDRSRGELHAALRTTLAGRGVAVLASAEAQDQNGFAVTTGFAFAEGVDTISDLAPLAPDLAFGGPPECPNRPYCLPGLEEVYGLRFGSVRTIATRAETIEALLTGEIDVGLLETTDARVGLAPVKLLVDDLELQPPEHVTPLVRTEVLDEHPALREVFDEVSERLSTPDVVRLNRAVELEGLTAAEAAEQWWDRR